MATSNKDRESKKQEISQLWGIPISDIEQKLLLLSSIIANVSDIILLDYLQQCDLNVESAVNYHFSRSLSPSPNINNVNNINNINYNPDNNNNNHNNNNNISMNIPFKFKINELILIYINNLLYKSKIINLKMTSNGPMYYINYQTNNNNNEWVNQDKILPFTFKNMKLMKTLQENASETSKQPVIKSMDIDNDNNNNNENNENNDTKMNKRRSKRHTNVISYKYTTFKLSDEESTESESNTYDDSESEEYIPSININNNKNKTKNKTRNRKRKYNNNNKLKETPQNKRRKTINTNTNSSMKEEKDSENDESCDETSVETFENIVNNNNTILLPVLPLNHLTWTRLSFGTVSIKYRVQNGSNINSIHDLWWQSDGGISIEYPDIHPWFGEDYIKIKNIYTDIIQEMNNQSSYIKVEIKHTKLLSLSDRALVLIDPTAEIVLPFTQKRNNNKNITTFWGFGFDDDEFKSTTPGIYESQFEIYITRLIETIGVDAKCKIIKVNNNCFDIAMIKCIAYSSANKGIYDDYMDTINIVDEYKNNGYKWTLAHLLDYACKYSYDEYININQIKYHVNVQLYPYQCQSIEWMIAEENHPIGFYRHFYKYGETINKDGFFYISQMFGQIVINTYLPSVHGGFLCEEMGLGKTVEILSLITCNKRRDFIYNGKLIVSCCEVVKKSRLDDEKKEIIEWEEEYKYYKSSATLIIAPVSLVGQWEKETAEKCRKSLNVSRYYGPNRGQNIKTYINKDIVYTTYGILAKEKGNDRKKHILHCIEWYRIILDESHYIKNGNNVCSKSINKLKGVNKWLLTGTPFGTKLYDIHNQLKFLGFKDEHLSQIDVKRVSTRNFNPKSRGWKNENDCVPILKIMKYLVMRHKKQQQFNNKKIVSLSHKFENVIYISFNQQEKKYYDKLFDISKERYLIYKSTGNIGRGTIQILSSLHPARQACSGHIYKKEEIELQLSKAQTATYRVREMVNDKRNKNKSAQELFDLAQFEAYNVSDQECPICYETPFDDPLQTPCRHIYCGECIKSILTEKSQCPMCRKKCTIKQLKKPPKEDGEQDNEIDMENEKENEKEKEQKDDDKKVDENVIDDSDINGMIKFDSKLNRLMRELNILKKEKPDDKSLIFTSFSKSLSWICEELNKNGFKYKTLTGSMSMNKRKKSLESFANDVETKIFVLTVRSGAVGITLTRANHVFMMEPQFNPALYRQAINRVHRLGQKKKVYIHTLIMKDSIEEKIWNINKDKINFNSSDENRLNASEQDVSGSITRDNNAKLQSFEIAQLFE